MSFASTDYLGMVERLEEGNMMEEGRGEGGLAGKMMEKREGGMRVDRLIWSAYQAGEGVL